MRQVVRRHLDEVAVESGEQLPVLRLVGGLGFAAPGSALEAGFELRGIESIQEFNERGAGRLLRCQLVSLGFGDRLPQPPHGIETAILVR